MYYYPAEGFNYDLILKSNLTQGGSFSIYLGTWILPFITWICSILWWKHYHIVIHASQLGRPCLALIVLFSSFKLTMWIGASYLYFSLTRPNTITSVGTWLTSIFLSKLQTRQQVFLRANQERRACWRGLLLTAWCITFASNVQKTSANILRIVFVFY